ncbi:MAG: anthrone oxygenase family protein [Pseudomonadota bacterium]
MNSEQGSLTVIAKILSFVQAVLLAAIFGFFYAYACSVMWGLDLAGGSTAIRAMNAINTEVRNAVFAPAFFGPLPIGLLTVAFLWFANLKKPAAWFAAALVVYFLGAFLVTAMGAVPMNRELLAADIPTDPAEAIEAWNAYSTIWQDINWIRTGFSGLAFLLAAIGIYNLGKQNPLKS